jgi:hypothetical protein
MNVSASYSNLDSIICVKCNQRIGERNEIAFRTNNRTQTIDRVHKLCAPRIPATEKQKRNFLNQGTFSQTRSSGSSLGNRTVVFPWPLLGVCCKAVCLFTDCCGLDSE